MKAGSAVTEEISPNRKKGKNDAGVLATQREGRQPFAAGGCVRYSALEVWNVLGVPTRIKQRHSREGGNLDERFGIESYV
jgi:hypothetical protein